MGRRNATTNRELLDGVSLMLNCHMDDKARDVCDVCGKVAFRSEHLAEARSAELNEAQPPDGVLYSVYPGDCGYWHLTTIWTGWLRGIEL